MSKCKKLWIGEETNTEEMTSVLCIIMGVFLKGSYGLQRPGVDGGLFYYLI